MARMIVDNHWRRRGITALLAGFALLNAGCYKATGGGWIEAALGTGGDRASFGFSAMCKNTTMENGSPGAALYDGQLEWHDGFVRFHGDVEPFDFMVLPGRCKDQDVRSMLVGQQMAFGGTYRPQAGGEPGGFTVGVMDAGTPGANGDFIIIQLLGGQFTGYENFGTLQGGNIQVF